MHTKQSRASLITRRVLLGLLLAAIFWAIAWLDWELIGEAVAAVSLPGIAAMAVAWIAAIFTRPFRLKIIVHAIAPEITGRYWPTWSASIIAMATNSVVPMRAGDVTMAFLLHENLGIGMARAFSVILIDRFFDLMTVIVIFVAALSVAPTVAPWASNLTVALLSALVGLTTALWFTVRMRRIWILVFHRLLSPRLLKRSERWRAWVNDLVSGLAFINKPAVVCPVLLLSIGFWGAIVTSTWFGVNAVWPLVPFAGAAFATAVVALCFIVPVAPGGLGVFHAAVVLALSVFSVPTEPALAFALIAHAFQLTSVMVLAAIVLLCQRKSLRSLMAIRETSP